MSRNLSNWLRAYMEFTRETESPDAYHFWTGATIIGSMTKRQVYLDMNYFKIFPNFYTILVGPSGARKSVAVALGMRLASEAGLKKFSDKITGAALIKDLSEIQEKRIEGAEIEFCSPLLVYASELGVFMGPDAYGSGTIADLTDLYDCPPTWEKKTIGRGTESVMGPYVSMLAASTPQTLKDVVPQGAVGQGFTSRIIFVWAGGRRKKVPMPKWDKSHTFLQKELIHDLKEISNIRGLFKFDPDGYQLYKQHYLDRPEPEDEFEDERLRGYASRKDIHTLKLAMVLSLADKNELIITERDIAGAIDAIKWLDQGLPNVFAGHGTSASAEDAARIFRQIETATRRVGYCSHQELTKRNYAYVNADELELVLRTLMDAGAIDEKVAHDPRTHKQARLFKAIDSTFLRGGTVKVTKKYGPKE